MNAKPWVRAEDLGKWGARAALATVIAVALAGCAGTMPTLGGGGTVATGGAGGATAENASSQLEKCSESLGTMAVVEDQNTPWYRTLTQYRPVRRTRATPDDPAVELLRGIERGQADST